VIGRSRHDAFRRVALVLTLAMLAATLWPSGRPEPADPFFSLLTSTYGLSDAIRNLLLFVPLGAAFRLAGLRGWRLPAAMFALSAAIEVIQLWVPGRHTSLRDLVCNAAGGIAGGTLAATTRYWALAPPARAGRIAVAVSLACVGLFALVVHLFAPSFPRTLYFGGLAPEFGHLARFDGVVRRAALGPLEIPIGKVADSARLRAHLLAGDPLEVEAVLGTRSARLAPIVSIHDDHQREILILGTEGDDLIFRERTRSLAWGLDLPEYRVEGALRYSRPGDPVAVRAQRRGRTTCVSVNGAERCDLGFTLADGWQLTFLLPELVPRGLGVALNATWLASVVLPAGWFLYAGRRRASAWLAALLLAIGLTGPAVLGSVEPLRGTEWLGVAAGLALGAVGDALVRARFSHLAR
jgi:hypothetical protein